MSAPVGAIVAIYVDTPTPMDVGDVVTTPTGRAYLVLAVRVQVKGQRRGRQHLRVMVSDPAELPAAGKRFMLRWYKRGRGR